MQDDAAGEEQAGKRTCCRGEDQMPSRRHGRVLKRVVNLQTRRSRRPQVRGDSQSEQTSELLGQRTG
jgi:hypothetical protein